MKNILNLNESILAYDGPPSEFAEDVGNEDNTDQISAMAFIEAEAETAGSIPRKERAKKGTISTKASMKNISAEQLIKSLAQMNHPEKILAKVIKEVFKQLAEHGPVQIKKGTLVPVQKKTHVTRVVEKTTNMSTAEMYRININYYINAKYYTMAHRAVEQGLSICTRENFLEWCKSNKEFVAKFDAWKKHKNKRSYAPVVTRVSKKKGYFPSNLTIK